VAEEEVVEAYGVVVEVLLQRVVVVLGDDAVVEHDDEEEPLGHPDHHLEDDGEKVVVACYCYADGAVVRRRLPVGHEIRQGRAVHHHEIHPEDLLLGRAVRHFPVEEEE
jgi:hypothetical protein